MTNTEECVKRAWFTHLSAIFKTLFCPGLFSCANTVDNDVALSKDLQDGVRFSEYIYIIQYCTVVHLVGQPASPVRGQLCLSACRYKKQEFFL